MVGRRLGLLCLCWLLPLWSLASTEFTASVDRKHITEQETFNLLLRYHQQVSDRPDFSSLERDFDILNTRTSNQFRSINGKTESYTEWQLVLAPKKTGEFIIPALSFRGSRTVPVAISVKPLSADVRAQQDKEFFFNVEISKGPYRVQGQILYIEKLYYSVNHERPSLSELKVTDARVEALGDPRQYTTTIDGQRLGVYERRFAIFPEQSGELVIPGQRFRAQVVNPYNRWASSREASVVSRIIRLDVDPAPDNYPPAPWIPARALVITEQLPTDNWQVGTPITRTLTVTAEGLSGSQIPALAIPEVAGLRYYPDQNQHQDQILDSGLTGTLTQAMAIVPTQPGTVTLPEIRVPWWNMRSQQLEYAVVPAHTIEVAAAPNNSAAAPSLPTVSSNENGATPAPVLNSEHGAPSSMVWWALMASAVINVLLIIALLWRRKPTVANQDSQQSNGTANNDSLKQACRSDDPARIRSALLAWAQQQPTLAGSQSLNELGQRLQQPQLQAALAELDQTLYGAADNSAYNGSNLWHLIKQWKPSQDGNNKAALAPLYPTV
ncbi:hypothetical protein CHH28_13400 [Bacterioplanes sanyensis]|uniref:DUF7939 domain-containing protein n=1 Tax=Bacterioplanes sanyensis TaxID=1249553 RepID=A0A222FKP8_9GAMM|nr:BatD family protein [Bacterioplanes sanyensis]ASP39605.1 hypothetical protein CHH28_13400 [Bacterioplanes sanyensis]